ncbi:hypothetical protein MHH_c10230 [Mannheimia haemolytica M42548]|nr:hypothetical protein MHH_c10230 [Mannheimia haemolytica M42548]
MGEGRIFLRSEEKSGRGVSGYFYLKFYKFLPLSEKYF